MPLALVIPALLQGAQLAAQAVAQHPFAGAALWAGLVGHRAVRHYVPQDTPAVLVDTDKPRKITFRLSDYGEEPISFTIQVSGSGEAARLDVAQPSDRESEENTADNFADKYKTVGNDEIEPKGDYGHGAAGSVRGAPVGDDDATQAATPTLLLSLWNHVYGYALILSTYASAIFAAVCGFPLSFLNHPWPPNPTTLLSTIPKLSSTNKVYPVFLLSLRIACTTLSLALLAAYSARQFNMELLISLLSFSFLHIIAAGTTESYLIDIFAILLLFELVALMKLQVPRNIIRTLYLQVCFPLTGLLVLQNYWGGLYMERILPPGRVNYRVIAWQSWLYLRAKGRFIKTLFLSLPIRYTIPRVLSRLDFGGHAAAYISADAYNATKELRYSYLAQLLQYQRAWETEWWQHWPLFGFYPWSGPACTKYVCDGEPWTGSWLNDATHRPPSPLLLFDTCVDGWCDMLDRRWIFRIPAIIFFVGVPMLAFIMLLHAAPSDDRPPSRDQLRQEEVAKTFCNNMAILADTPSQYDNSTRCKRFVNFFCRLYASICHWCTWGFGPRWQVPDNISRNDIPDGHDDKTINRRFFIGLVALPLSTIFSWGCMCIINVQIECTQDVLIGLLVIFIMLLLHKWSNKLPTLVVSLFDDPPSPSYENSIIERCLETAYLAFDNCIIPVVELSLAILFDYVGPCMNAIHSLIYIFIGIAIHDLPAWLLTRPLHINYWAVAYELRLFFNGAIQLVPYFLTGILGSRIVRLDPSGRLVWFNPIWLDPANLGAEAPAITPPPRDPGFICATPGAWSPEVNGPAESYNDDVPELDALDEVPPSPAASDGSGYHGDLPDLDVTDSEGSDDEDNDDLGASTLIFPKIRGHLQPTVEDIAEFQDEPNEPVLETQIPRSTIEKNESEDEEVPIDGEEVPIDKVGSENKEDILGEDERKDEEDEPINKDEVEDEEESDWISNLPKTMNPDQPEVLPEDNDTKISEFRAAHDRAQQEARNLVLQISQATQQPSAVDDDPDVAQRCASINAIVASELARMKRDAAQRQVQPQKPAAQPQQPEIAPTYQVESPTVQSPDGLAAIQERITEAYQKFKDEAERAANMSTEKAKAKLKPDTRNNKKTFENSKLCDQENAHQERVKQVAAQQKRAEEEREEKQERLAQEQRVAEEQKRTEAQQVAKDQRIANAHKLIAQRQSKQKKLAEEKKRAEEKRIAEEKRMADEKHTAEQTKRAKEQWLADKVKLDNSMNLVAQHNSKEKKLADERRASEKKMRAEEQRAQLRRQAEERKHAQERKHQEDEREAEEKKRTEDELERALADLELIVAEKRRLEEEEEAGKLAEETQKRQAEEASKLASEQDRKRVQEEVAAAAAAAAKAVREQAEKRANEVAAKVAQKEAKHFDRNQAAKLFSNKPPSSQLPASGFGKLRLPMGKKAGWMAGLFEETSSTRSSSSTARPNFLAGSNSYSGSDFGSLPLPEPKDYKPHGQLVADPTTGKVSTKYFNKNGQETDEFGFLPGELSDSGDEKDSEPTPVPSVRRPKTLQTPTPTALQYNIQTPSTPTPAAPCPRFQATPAAPQNEPQSTTQATQTQSPAASKTVEKKDSAATAPSPRVSSGGDGPPPPDDSDSDSDAGDEKNNSKPPLKPDNSEPPEKDTLAPDERVKLPRKEGDKWLNGLGQETNELGIPIKDLSDILGRQSYPRQFSEEYSAAHNVPASSQINTEKNIIDRVLGGGTLWSMRSRRAKKLDEKPPPTTSSPSKIPPPATLEPKEQAPSVEPRRKPDDKTKRPPLSGTSCRPRSTDRSTEEDEDDDHGKKPGDRGSGGIVTSEAEKTNARPSVTASSRTSSNGSNPMSKSKGSRDQLQSLPSLGPLAMPHSPSFEKPPRTFSRESVISGIPEKKSMKGSSVSSFPPTKEPEKKAQISNDYFSFGTKVEGMNSSRMNLFSSNPTSKKSSSFVSTSSGAISFTFGAGPPIPKTSAAECLPSERAPITLGMVSLPTAKPGASSSTQKLAPRAAKVQPAPTAKPKTPPIFTRQTPVVPTPTPSPQAPLPTNSQPVNSFTTPPSVVTIPGLTFVTPPSLGIPPSQALPGPFLTSGPQPHLDNDSMDVDIPVAKKNTIDDTMSVSNNFSNDFYSDNKGDASEMDMGKDSIHPTTTEPKKVPPLINAQAAKSLGTQSSPFMFQFNSANADLLGGDTLSTQYKDSDGDVSMSAESKDTPSSSSPVGPQSAPLFSGTFFGGATPTAFPDFGRPLQRPISSGAMPQDSSFHGPKIGASAKQLGIQGCNFGTTTVGTPFVLGASSNPQTPFTDAPMEEGDTTSSSPPNIVANPEAMPEDVMMSEVPVDIPTQSGRHVDIGPTEDGLAEDGDIYIPPAPPIVEEVPTTPYDSSSGPSPTSSADGANMDYALTDGIDSIKWGDDDESDSEVHGLDAMQAGGDKNSPTVSDLSPEVGSNKTDFKVNPSGVLPDDADTLSGINLPQATGPPSFGTRPRLNIAPQATEPSPETRSRFDTTKLPGAPSYSNPFPPKPSPMPASISRPSFAPESRFMSKPGVMPSYQPPGQISSRSSTQSSQSFAKTKDRIPSYLGPHSTPGHNPPETLSQSETRTNSSRPFSTFVRPGTIGGTHVGASLPAPPKHHPKNATPSHTCLYCVAGWISI